MAYTELKNDAVAGNSTIAAKGILSAKGLKNNEKILVDIFIGATYAINDELDDAKWHALSDENDAPVYVSAQRKSIRLPSEQQYRFVSEISEKTVLLAFNSEV